MSFSKHFYGNNAQNYINNEVNFEKSSFNSKILKRKRKSIKKLQYYRALQMPNSKDFKQYSYSEDDILVNYLIWIHTNLVDFFLDAQFLYNYKISSICTSKLCGGMTIGPCRIFIWPFGKDDESEEEISITSAEYYIKESFKWIYSLFTDKNTFFPSSEEEYKNYHKSTKLVTKRLFRFYAHCYYHHLKEIKADDTFFTLFYSSMRFFISFTLKYELLDLFEYEPLKMIVSPFNEYDSSKYEEESEFENLNENQVILTSDSEN